MDVDLFVHICAGERYTIYAHINAYVRIRICVQRLEMASWVSCRVRLLYNISNNWHLIINQSAQCRHFISYFIWVFFFSFSFPFSRCFCFCFFFCILYINVYCCFEVVLILFFYFPLLTEQPPSAPAVALRLSSQPLSVAPCRSYGIRYNEVNAITAAITNSSPIISWHLSYICNNVDMY